MKRIALLLLFACGCASAPARTAASPAPAGAAPYDAAPAAAHSIEVTIDDRAAREILASLSRPRLESSDPKVLQDLPAVRLAIADSNRAPDVFERDFAANCRQPVTATMASDKLRAQFAGVKSEIISSERRRISSSRVFERLDTFCINWAS